MDTTEHDMDTTEHQDIRSDMPDLAEQDARSLVRALDALPIPAAEARAAVRRSLRRSHQVDVADTVCGHVRRWAERTPDAVALLDRHGTVTYRQLVARVCGVRAFLADRGCRPGTLLAVAGPRGIESVVVLLALESMAITYLPVDAGWPQERLATVLRRSAADRLLSYHRDTDLAAPAGVPLLELPEPHALPEDSATTWRDRCEDPAEPRYVYFTSGTTGVPKGALNEHRGMVNHLWAKVLDLDLGPADTVAFTAPLTFDIAIWQMLAPFLVGGSVAALDDRDMAFPRTLVKRLGRLGASVLELVPTLLEWLVDGGAGRADRGLPRLRRIVSTGEELSPGLAERLLKRYPDAAVVNAYGFTETSDDVTHHVVRPEDLAESRLPVGSPVVNTVLYTLVDDGAGRWRAARPGESGELFVGGLPPGCGYLGDGAATASAFFRDVLDPASPTGRLYRSGDLVSVDDTGVVRYQGRLDRQVKVTGVRMELGEIEAALRRHPAVADCAVVAVDAEDGTGRRELVAYCVHGPGPLDTDALRGFLGDILPAAMIPRRWHTLDALPVTANGKTDHRALTRRPAAGDGGGGRGVSRT